MKTCLIVLILLTGVMSGCTNDERIVKMAKESVETQRQQNAMMAQQSQAVVAESARLAETAKSLVEQEANTRTYLLAAQRELQTQATVLDNERRELMNLRIREPVIAASLQLIGGILFCCLPLALVGILLWPKPNETESVVQLNQILIDEISAGESSLLYVDRCQARLEVTNTANNPSPHEKP